MIRIAVYEETGKLIGQRILPLDGLQAGRFLLSTIQHSVFLVVLVHSGYLRLLLTVHGNK